MSNNKLTVSIFLITSIISVILPVINCIANGTASSNSVLPKAKLELNIIPTEEIGTDIEFFKATGIIEEYNGETPTTAQTILIHYSSDNSIKRISISDKKTLNHTMSYPITVETFLTNEQIAEGDKLKAFFWSDTGKCTPYTTSVSLDPNQKFINTINFDNITRIKDANLEGGGGYNIQYASLDNNIYYGNSGKSILFDNRTDFYSRLKVMKTFDGLDITPGTQYDISLWAKVGENSAVNSGCFYLSVVDIDGSLSEGLAYYSDRENYKFIVNKNDWTKLTLRYTTAGHPLYGIAVEQLSRPGYRSVVPALNIDNIEIRMIGKTSDIPPSIPGGIRVYVDKKLIPFSYARPQLKDNVVICPVAEVFPEYSYNSSNKTLTISKNEKELVLFIDSKTALLNGNQVELDHPVIINGDIIKIPLKSVAEYLGANVYWDSSKYIMHIKFNTDSTITINRDIVQQEIWGFGAAANDPVYDLMTIATEETKKEILDQLFSTEGSGAGLSIIRLEVNPFRKDDPKPRNAIQATILPEDGVWDFDTDHHQRWFANEALKRNSNIQFAASVWSPPLWMKDSNAENYGHLKKENYGKFAEYLKVWTQTYLNYGYNIRWLSVQNEPDLEKVGATWAVCEYTYEELDAVASLVADTFAGANLPTLVGAPEGSSLETTMNYLENMSAETINKLGFIATHFYGWNVNSLNQYPLERYNKPMFQMEFCGPTIDDPGIDNGIYIAKQLSAALDKGYNAYLYWWSVSQAGTPGTPTNRQALVDFKTDGSYTFTKRLYTIGQYSRFLKPGQYKISAQSGDSDLIVTAAKDIDTGKVNIVVINDSPFSINATISGLQSNTVSLYRTSATENIAKLNDHTVVGGKITHTFAPNSVTTIVEK